MAGVDNAPEDAVDEPVVAIHSILEQIQDRSIPVTARITAIIQARSFLESLTRRLVNEAREQSTSWEDIGVLFGTSKVNAKARYGDYNDYDD